MTWRRQWEGDTKTHTGTSFEVKLNDYKSPTGNIREHHTLSVVFTLHSMKGIFTIKFPHIGTLSHCIDIYRLHFYAFLLPKFYNYLNIYGRICQNCDKIIHMCYL